MLFWHILAMIRSLIKAIDWRMVTAHYRDSHSGMDNHTPKIPSFDCGAYVSDLSKINNMKRVRVWPNNWVCLSLTSSCGARIYGGDAMMYPSSKAQWSNLLSPSWTHTSACWSRCPAFKPASGAFSERELRKVKKPLPFSRNSMKYLNWQILKVSSIFRKTPCQKDLNGLEKSRFCHHVCT